MPTRLRSYVLSLYATSLLVAFACGLPEDKQGPDSADNGSDNGSDNGGDASDSAAEQSQDSSDDATGGESDEMDLGEDDAWDDDEGDDDEGGDESGESTGSVEPPCGGAADQYCQKIDLLFVIDNSGTMGEEQVNLAKNYPRLIEQLQQLKTSGSMQKDVAVDVNLMVTSTDMGHPICTPFEPEHYDPLHGRPNSSSCRERLGDFTGLGTNPPQFEHACVDYCPDVDVEPSDPFIHFVGKASHSNVKDDRVADALSCIGPQGVNGCGYEAPLESMMQALYPGAPWNDPRQTDKPFMREDATLAVVIMTDEADCSVRSPDGYAHFTDPAQSEFWAVDPTTGEKKASSAVCWNAGVECDANGNCMSADKDVLHPLSRYKDFLNGYVKKSGPGGHKDVVMLGILGVPPVTKHNELPPYEPIEGGVYDLVYRPWQDADILPGDPDSREQKQFEFGIGPGCTGRDADGEPTGQAIPPVRIKEVCESLNYKEGDVDQVRCCIESICDDDFSSAIRCLSGLIENVIPPM